MNIELETKKYEKHQSFDTFISNLNNDFEMQRQRIINILNAYVVVEEPLIGKREIIFKILESLTAHDYMNAEFKLTVPIMDDVSKIDDIDIPRYFYHRYRYDVYPKKKILDDYPPYLQIEPTSICNYRCRFCYQTDADFTKKMNGYMGMMSLELFKEIIDQSVGNVEFISLASRGEPLICRGMDKMLEYCVGKFLGLKMNTNASLLTEKLCHAILAGGVNTIVFSIDAVEEPLYSQLRVYGKLENVLRNIKMFYAIKRKHYPNSRIITRASGVRFTETQSMKKMENILSTLVDQICFVEYNSWENVYMSEVNEIVTPCSDLWRRMFIWFNGQVNPCDADFKSSLSVGAYGKSTATISKLWRTDAYNKLRDVHLNKQRKTINPCQGCAVI